MIQLTKNERACLDEIQRTLQDLTDFLTTHQFRADEATPLELYQFLSRMKAIQGNASIAMSLLGCVLARDYLYRTLEMQPFDAAGKAQGAKGLDIDERTVDGRRVIGELKTTSPENGTDLGGNQKTKFREDFKKLNTTQADLKFFFVTEPDTFAVVKQKYAVEIPGVRIVCLTTGEECQSLPKGCF
jgi:hypothetical protein